MTTTLEAINTGALQLPEPSNDPAAPLVMINPEILKYSDECGAARR